MKEDRYTSVLRLWGNVSSYGAVAAVEIYRIIMDTLL